MPVLGGRRGARRSGTGRVCEGMRSEMHLGRLRRATPFSLRQAAGTRDAAPRRGRATPSGLHLMSSGHMRFAGLE
jgi:hypothetical protein